jgi:asparagine synthase (glutamine-hydrolysing)
MAGIFGVCHFDDRPIDPLLIARMSTAAAQEGRDGESVCIEGSTAMGCRVLGETPTSAARQQPVRCPSGTTVVFDGRLDNRDHLIAALRDRSEVSAAMPDARLAAASYDVHGTHFARHLLGDFAIAVFDARERRVVLATDGMGVRPLYYRRGETTVAFASAIRSLLADPDCHAHPNNQLLAELMLRRAHRRICDGSTLFAGVSQVPPGHVAIFTAHGVQLDRYWDLNRDRPRSPLSFNDYADAFRYHFQRAVARRLRSAHPVAIAVSGGLDSSAIFCTAANHAAATPIGLTYTALDGGEADESAYVAMVEAACGQPIHYVHTPLEGVLFQSSEIVRCVEAPMLDGQWFRGHRLMTAVTKAGARTLLTGHWGDQLLFDQAYLVDLLRKGALRTIGTHLDEYLRWFPDARGDEFRTQFASDVLEYALPRSVRPAVRAVRRRRSLPQPWDDWYAESFRREARADVFPHAEGATALANALYREVRSQYHHLCLAWNAKVGTLYGVEPAFPFLDRDLVEFLVGVPGPVLVRDGVPKALLRESLGGVVPDAILRRRAKADFTAGVNRATKHDIAALTQTLGPDALVIQLGYVDAAKLKKGLAAADSALEHPVTNVVSRRVIGVAALEIWLRQFTDCAERSKETEWQKITSLTSAR